VKIGVVVRSTRDEFEAVVGETSLLKERDKVSREPVPGVRH